MAGRRRVKLPPLPLAEAKARLLALAPALPVEQRTIQQCLGHFLAEPLLARRTQPSAALSAMDGYALRAADLPGPWRAIGESAAGHPFLGTVGTNQAVQISTGAVVPNGADMVLLQEDSTREAETLRLTGEPPTPPERHIRPAGMDFTSDSLLIEPGTRIGPAQMALAIAGGHSHLSVRRAVTVTVIDGGDELVAPGMLPELHQMPASNGPMLCAMAAALPTTITHCGPIADKFDDLAVALEAASDSDVIITSGGASVGDHDLVRPALAAIGATIDFWRVGIKPGKPLLIATRGHQIILGLPGNPASAYVTAFLFMLPLLRAMLGAAQPLPFAIQARLTSPMARGGSRMEFLRANWDGATVTLDPLQDSGALSPLARANALVVREAWANAKPAGTDVPVYLIENGGFA